MLKKTTKILYLAPKTAFNICHLKSEGKIEILSDKQKSFLAKYLHNKKDQRSLFWMKRNNTEITLDIGYQILRSIGKNEKKTNNIWINIKYYIYSSIFKSQFTNAKPIVMYCGFYNIC